jgi:hypothetical protein
MTGKLSVLVEAFKPHHGNTLRGFVTVVIPEIRLRILDLTVHEKNGSRWVGLPAKPQIDRDGTVRKDDRGRTLYTTVVEFTNKKVRDAFSARVIKALLEFAPAAFDTEDAA